MMNVAAGLTATKAALDIAKVVMDKLNAPNPDVHGVRASVQELLIHVVNAQVALGQAQVELSELRGKLDDRDAVKATELDLEYQVDGGYYLRKSDGAFCCPVCWGDQKRAVPLVPHGAPIYGRHICALHKGLYQTKDGREAEQRAANQHQPHAWRGGPNGWMAS